MAWKDIPVAQKKASAFDVIVSDPKLLVLDADEPTGPYMFAVFGNQVLFDDPGDEDVVTYTNGHRTGGAAINSPGALSGTNLTAVRVLPGELVARNTQAWLHFSGPHLVGEAWRDDPVLLDFAGPLAEPTFGQTVEVFTVQLRGGDPADPHPPRARQHRPCAARCRLRLLPDGGLRPGQRFRGPGNHVYRVALCTNSVPTTRPSRYSACTPTPERPGRAGVGSGTETGDGSARHA